MKKLILPTTLFSALFFLLWFEFLQVVDAKAEHVNSIGIKMYPVPRGKFMMGSDLSELDHWDERPVREVTIGSDFMISESEVTVEQYKQFDPDYDLDGHFGGYAGGISWYDAVEFCKWLSKKEGKNYRLPTEAEWEFACRAGTTTLYASGDNAPKDGWANAWGIKNMHTGVREWCYDWYGDYPEHSQTDPVGPARGMARVVRGGCLDNEGDYHGRKIFDASSNRSSIAPTFGVIKKDSALKKSDSEKESGQLVFEKGLFGVWFGDPDFTRSQGTVLLDNLNDSSLTGKYKGNGWSAKYQGFLKAPCSGEVTFKMEVSTGGILEIEGRKVIDRWTSKAPDTGTFKMVKDKMYPVQISYHRDGEDSFLKLSWSWADKELAFVSKDAIFHSLDDAEAAKSKYQDRQIVMGNHWIGFRVVQAPQPSTKPTTYQNSFVRQGVSGNSGLVKHAPDSDKPYFRKRYMLPLPFGELRSNQEIYNAGFHPSFRPHNHSPAVEVCPNGDVLMITYSSGPREYEPEVTLVATRLRFGADQWDMPERSISFATGNNHAPMLWTDNDMLHFFWGSPRMGGAFPFQWMSSSNSGATWDAVKFPKFTNDVGPHSPQPINTAFRNAEGTMFVASDAVGPKSVLWASKDNGQTWYDTQGRSGGRHTTYALLSDGKTILGMGGKSSNIDGYMPKSISADGGKTWKVTKTPIPALGGNQRPSLLRLKSGRLFFAGDSQDIQGKKPAGVKHDGAYVALSDDDGKTWIVKELSVAQRHRFKNALGGNTTLGYSTARQAPNGMIHLITSLNIPCLHFEFNEAWILSGEDYNSASDKELMTSSATSIKNVKKYVEKYPNGNVKVKYKGGIANDGRFLLHGPQTWYYQNGALQRNAEYKLGRKVGQETYLCTTGQIIWQWDHLDNGTSRWTQYWSNGKMKARSHWRNYKCNGTAERWDIDGKPLTSVEFVNGSMQ